jgi:Tfp pilus assembly protein PilO
MAAHRYFRYFTYIEPVIKTPLVRTYGSLILTIFALSIFTIFAIKPTIETILILQKDLQEQKQILSALNLKSQNLNLGSKNYQTLVTQGIKQKIDASIPLSPEIGQLVNVLESHSKVPSASLAAIQFQPFTISPGEEQTLTEIPFIYNIEGSYESLLLVLGRLRSSERLVTIDNLTINKLEGGGLLMSITGKAYYLK